jgi:murein L,D-transpeptidase YafK
MNWMIEDSFHALIVDKSQQRLSVWEVRGGEPRMIESYQCATGEQDGDKWVRGDMKTPEGVYFFCSVIDGRSLPSKYGLWALTTDYPNFVDRRRGKSGDGIWLHGRDKPLGSKPDSNGCIALENADLIKVSRFVRLQSTPLIVVKKMLMAPRSRIMEQERELRNFVEAWRRAWESHDLDSYMANYSRNFQSSWLDWNGWREKKRRLNNRYSKIRVRLGNVYLYRQNGLITSIFTQAYESDMFKSTGVKILYITEAGKYQIYAEDYHQQIDDPWPVKTFLARVGAESVPEEAAAAEPKSEFRIRLVSTDEPDTKHRDDIESPRPVAPSRGIVLERVAVKASDKSFALPLEGNDKLATRDTPEPMITAQALPVEVPVLRQAGNNRARRMLVVETLAPASSVVSQAIVQPGGNLVQSSDQETFWAVAATKPRTESPRREEKKGSEDVVGQRPSNVAGGGTNVEERKAVMEFLHRWKCSWEEKDLDTYLKMYHPDFQVDEVKYEKFAASKKGFFAKYRTIRIEVDQVEIRKVEGRLQVKFRQTFKGDNYRDKGWKSMVLAGNKDKGFRIFSERWSPL